MSLQTHYFRQRIIIYAAIIGPEVFYAFKTNHRRYWNITDKYFLSFRSTELLTKFWDDELDRSNFLLHTFKKDEFFIELDHILILVD